MVEPEKGRFHFQPRVPWLNHVTTRTSSSVDWYTRRFRGLSYVKILFVPPLGVHDLISESLRGAAGVPRIGCVAPREVRALYPVPGQPILHRHNSQARCETAATARAPWPSPQRAAHPTVHEPRWNMSVSSQVTLFNIHSTAPTSNHVTSSRQDMLSPARIATLAVRPSRRTRRLLPAICQDLLRRLPNLVGQPRRRRRLEQLLMLLA